MKQELGITNDNDFIDYKKNNLLDLDIIHVMDLFVRVIKDYKNIKKDRIYFCKKKATRPSDGQGFYLIKGRWIHSRYTTKLANKDAIAFLRKFKIKKLLHGK